MAPQPPSHVNLVTPPLQMDHFDFFSALRAPLLALALPPKTVLLPCSEFQTPTSHTFCISSLPWCDSPCDHFMPIIRGRSIRVDAHYSQSGRPPSIPHPCYTCPRHNNMPQQPPHSTCKDTDRKPPRAPPLTSVTGSLPPNTDVASSSTPTPLPHPDFTDVQRETFQDLCKENAKMKLCQELMEKCLDWLLDSGAQEPS